MIHERLMAQGSFSIPFKQDTPWTVWENLDTFGHIVVFPQYVDAREFDDATLLSKARYAGVLLKKEINNRQMVFSGAGMVWWLADEEGKGEVYETPVTLSASSLSNALSQLLPDAITSGSVTEPFTTYTGTHNFESPLSAIRTVMAATSAEFRVNPDGTIDAGTNTDLFTILTPEVVVIRQGDGGGSDPNYYGIPSNLISGEYTSREYATRAILVETAADGSQTLADFYDATATAYDIHGNLIVRTFQTSVPTNAGGSYGLYVRSQLEHHVHREQERIKTDFYEVANGTWNVGDAYHVYDPPMFKDTSNPIWFRGDLIWPKKLRLVESSWTIRQRMGVYYRSPEVTPVWTDLTQYVDEELTDSIGILTHIENNAKGIDL